MRTRRGRGEIRTEHSARTVIPFLDPTIRSRRAELALQQPNGLLAAGGDLSPSRLLDAYAQGIFPWFGREDPLLWWSPDPRMVLYVRELQDLSIAAAHDPLRPIPRHDGHGVPRSDQRLRGASARTGWHLDHARDARRVLPAVRDGLRPLGRSLDRRSPRRRTLRRLARAACSSASRCSRRESDASKVGFVHMVAQFARWGMPLIDCQMPTSHLASFGAREIPRADFLDQVSQLVQESAPPTPWRLDEDLSERSE